MSEEKTEDLDKELEDALKESEKVEEPETPPAEKPAEEEKTVVEPAEPIVEPADEAETKVVTPEPPKADEKSPQIFKNVKEFLDAVEDQPSRNLLEKFYSVMKAETSATLAPLEQKNNETKFENEFSKYEKIDGLADYKNSLRKTFLRDPNQDIKGLIGGVVTDLQMSKVKPVESTPSSPNRGKPDLSNLSKEELYDTLATLKE